MIGLNRKKILFIGVFFCVLMLLGYFAVLWFAINRQEYHSFLQSYAREIIHIASDHHLNSYEDCVRYADSRRRNAVERYYRVMLITTPTGHGLVLEKRHKRILTTVRPDVVVRFLDDQGSYITDYGA